MMKKAFLAMAAAALLTAGTAFAQGVPGSCGGTPVQKKDGTGQGKRAGKKAGPQDGSGPIHQPGTGGGTGGGKRAGRR
jgi:hypothetical protein